MHKMETLLSLIEKNATYHMPRFSPTPSLDSVPPSPFLKEGGTDKQPFWVVPRSDVVMEGGEELGKGRWGVVRVATYRGDKVAARSLYSRIASEENQKVFVESMTTAAKMRHPNILPLLGVVLEGEPVILTELMPTNLRKVLDKGKLYNYQVASVALDVAEGLAFLHGSCPEPIAHGDIPASGVLLRKGSGNQWRAKLSDFMTARFFHSVITASGSDVSSDETALTSPSGGATPRATPPRSTPPPVSILYRNKKISDVSMGNRRLSANRKLSQTAPDMTSLSPLTIQRDVYSYGLLLIELCTGTPPLEVSLQFLVESITWSEMAALVRLCMEFNPSHRPDMAAVLNKVKAVHQSVAAVKPSKLNLHKLT